MKTKDIKLMALSAILMPVLFSCSGDGAETPLFGKLPGVYAKFQAEKDALKEEAKNIDSEAEKAKLIEKSEKMTEEWREKIEESAKALDGKPIEFAESNINVTEPLSLEFVDFFSELDLTPKFKINGSAEAAAEINTDFEYVLSFETVYIVGYDAENKQVYTHTAGFIPVENVDGKAVVKAAAPIKFEPIYFSGNKLDEYSAIQTLKLEILRL